MISLITLSLARKKATRRLLVIGLVFVFASSATAQGLGPRAYLPLVGRNSSTATPAHPVEILPNHSHYVDSIDSLWIVGEVQNNTDDYLRFVRLTTNVFDAQNQILDTSFGYIPLGTLPPRDKTCFAVILEQPTGWHHYTFELNYRTDGDPLPNLTLVSHNGSYDSAFGWYRIVGLVRNDHEARVEFVKPIGAVYGAAGTILGCNFTFTSTRDLDPGQSSSFDMYFTGQDYADATAYRLQVAGTLAGD